MQETFCCVIPLLQIINTMNKKGERRCDARRSSVRLTAQKWNNSLVSSPSVQQTAGVFVK